MNWPLIKTRNAMHGHTTVRWFLVECPTCAWKVSEGVGMCPKCGFLLTRHRED